MPIYVFLAVLCLRIGTFTKITHSNRKAPIALVSSDRHKTSWHGGMIVLKKEIYRNQN